MGTTYRCTIATTTSESTIEGTATPSTSQDGRLRAVWSTDDQGRGVSITIQPLSADTQFVFHGCAVDVVPSQAGPDEA